MFIKNCPGDEAAQQQEAGNGRGLWGEEEQPVPDQGGAGGEWLLHAAHLPPAHLHDPYAEDGYDDYLGCLAGFW